MNIEKRALEYMVEDMEKRIEQLEETISENEKIMEDTEGYEHGIYYGLNMSMKNEIEHLRRMIQFVHTTTK